MRSNMGYNPVIFLDPRVLMKPESAFAQNDRVEFDEVSCIAFRSLIERVNNTAVVLILPSGHEQIEAAYRTLDLGARIRGKIFAPLDASSCAFTIGVPVRDWLKMHQPCVSSFVIMERRGGGVHYSRSIVIGKYDRLTAEKVNEADDILTNMQFSPYQLATLY